MADDLSPPPPRPGGVVHAVLKFPFPYRAMLSIESDIDRTGLLRFRETHRFLNTLEETSLGPGLGLDVANSFWCYGTPYENPRAQAREVAYWTGPDGAPSWYAEELIAYARAGRFGTLHSYGRVGEDFVRADAERALEMLAAHDVRFRIWTNHGHQHAQNIASSLYNLAAMTGGRPDSPGYHADLLADYGVRFFWTGGGPGTSEGEKMPMRPARLADGRQVWAFERSNRVGHSLAHADVLLRKGATLSDPRHAAASLVWQPYLLGLWLAPARLDRLVEAGEYCILAQHLGNQLTAVTFSPEAAAGLRRLKRYQDRGLILVASTERLLTYCLAAKFARVDVRCEGDACVIDVPLIDDPVGGAFAPGVADVRGLSVRIPQLPEGVGDLRVVVGGRPLGRADVFAEREGPGLVVGVRWHASDHADHSAPFVGDETADHYVRLHEGASASAAAAAEAPRPDGPFALTAAQCMFAANEAGFARVGQALLVGEHAEAWRRGVAATGSRVIEPPVGAGALDPADPAGSLAALAAEARRANQADRVIVSLPMPPASFAAALAAVQAGFPRGATRLLHVATGEAVLERALQALAAGEAAAAARLVGLLATAELRRIGPADLGGGPALLRDRAEVERAVFWSGAQNYGAVATGHAATEDLLGRRDLCLLVAARNERMRHSVRNLGRDPGGAGPDLLRRQIDFVAEAFGAGAALARLEESAAAVGERYVAVRRPCFRCRLDGGRASLGPVRALAGHDLAPDERLAVGRALFWAADPAEMASLLEPGRASAADTALLGWAHVRAKDFEAALAAFRRAFEWAPAELSAAIGVAHASLRLGSETDLADIAARHAEEAARAAVEAHAALARPAATGAGADELEPADEPASA